MTRFGFFYLFIFFICCRRCCFVLDSGTIATRFEAQPFVSCRALLSLLPSVAIARLHPSIPFVVVVAVVVFVAAAVAFNCCCRFSLFNVKRSVNEHNFFSLVFHGNDRVKVAAAANVSLPSGEIGIARI